VRREVILKCKAKTRKQVGSKLDKGFNYRKEIAMKKVLLTGAVLTVLGLLLAFTIPALAHGLGSDEATSTNNEAWEDMYEACQNGDWAAMTEAAGQFQSEDYDNMPYYENYNSMPDENGETSSEGWSGTGNHMGGGMMGGGMMGW